MEEPSKETPGAGLGDVLKEMWIHVGAIEVALVQLVKQATKTNPEFENEALSEFDQVLGKRLIARGTPTDYEGEIRKKVRFFIEMPKNPREEKPLIVKKLTLRRRFLNWLERD